MSTYALTVHSLFLDLASHQGLIACVGKDAVISSTPVDNRVSDADLLPLLEKTVKQAKWEMKDIEKIVCVTGPGGFTSLRVGVSLANALAWGLKIPLAGLHLRDLWIARANSSKLIAHSFFWLHSTKRELLFVGQGNQEPIPTPLSEFLESFQPGVMFTGELLPEHEAALTKKGAIRAKESAIEEILPSLIASLHLSEKPLEPWYGRGW